MALLSSPLGLFMDATNSRKVNWSALYCRWSRENIALSSSFKSPLASALSARLRRFLSADVNDISRDYTIKSEDEAGHLVVIEGVREIVGCVVIFVAVIGGVGDHDRRIPVFPKG